MNIPELFGNMIVLVEELKKQTGHIGDGHFGMSYRNRDGPDGWPTDSADIRCGCGVILQSFPKEERNASGPQ